MDRKSEQKRVKEQKAGAAGMLTDAEKAQFFADFNNGLHRIGRLLLIVSVILLVGVPFAVGVLNGVMPEGKVFRRRSLRPAFL